MNENDLLKEEPRLFEQLCSTLYLGVGFEQVKKNKGKPGIDGITIGDFETRLNEELSQLQEELQTGLTNPRQSGESKYPSREAKRKENWVYRRYGIAWYKQHLKAIAGTNL